MWRAEQVQIYDHNKLHIITGNLMAFLSHLKVFFPIVFTYMINISIKTTAKYHSLWKQQELKIHFQVSNATILYILGIHILEAYYLGKHLEGFFP